MSKSKFKNTEELEKAYKELEKEFTKKSQKLAEVEKTNYVTLLHNEMDSLLNDYAKRRISELEAKLAESEIKYAQLRFKQLEKDVKKYKNADKELLGENINLKDKVRELKQQLAEKEKEAITHKIEKLDYELLFTRLQWIHKEADECREEKERFGGIEDMALDSVWRVLDLQKHECCEYEEMVELEEGIKTIAEDKLLRDIEHDLGIKVTRTENEIFDDIKKLTHQHEDKGE